MDQNEESEQILEKIRESRAVRFWKVSTPMPGRFSKQAPETCQVLFSIFFECDLSVRRDEAFH
jgi:hypothetical protein